MTQLVRVYHIDLTEEVIFFLMSLYNFREQQDDFSRWTGGATYKHTLINIVYLFIFLFYFAGGLVVQLNNAIVHSI